MEETTFSFFDLEKMSKETGIALETIAGACGIVDEPLFYFEQYLQSVVEALTVKECREAYIKAPFGSKTEHAIYQKWNDLSLKEVAKATTSKETMKAYHGAPLASEAGRVAIKKLATFYGLNVT